MPNLTLLNLSSEAPEPVQSKHGLTLLDLKSDWQHDTPFYTPSAIYDKEFSVINLPAQFFNRGAISMREALAHELVFACLRIKALALQDVLPMIQQYRANDWEPDLTHPALPALRNPNPDNTFSDLLAFMAICEDVFGVVYLEKIRNRMRGVIGLAPLDPRTVNERPKPGAPTFPTYWNAISCYKLSDIDYYSIEEGGASRGLNVDDVIAIKTADIRSPLAGHSGVRAGMRAVGVDQNLDKYIDAYLMAGGPSGVLKIKNRRLEAEEAEDIAERWAKRYNIKSNATRSGKVAVFDEDGEYQQIGAHLEGLASDTLKQHDQAAICSALGVPGQLVGAYFAIRWGNQRAGQDAALTQFWQLTLSPTLTRYRTWLDKAFLSDFDGRQAGIASRVFWDLSNVKALQEDINKKATRYSTAYKDKAVSKNEYRTQLGLKSVPGGDFIPNDEEAYQQAQERFEQGDEPGDDSEPEEDNQKKSLKTKRNPPPEEADQLPGIKQAQDDAKEKLTAILLLLKAGLIEQGLEKLAVLQSEFARLSLTLTPEQEAQVRNAIAEAYLDGAATVTTSGMVMVDQPTVDSIATLVVGMLTAGVTARLVSGYAIRALRGLTARDILTEIATELSAESPALYESIASAGGFQAVATGRNNEAERRKYKRVYYSALLDANVCPPCKKKDGLWSDKAADLPPVPSPECDGKWRCRCVHVFVWE